MIPASVFAGVRVLDVGHIVAGPFVASILGDFGADVIKIERPGVGDPLRWIYPKDGVGLFYKVQARNKQSITLKIRGVNSINPAMRPDLWSSVMAAIQSSTQPMSTTMVENGYPNAR